MSGSVDQRFNQALADHQAGRLIEAEAAYRAILSVDPRHADALHLLGIIGLQTGNLQTALELVQSAVRIRPDGAVYRSNLGQILERLGRVDEAERCYREAISLDSACYEAMNNLGRLLQSRDRLDEAESLFQQAIQLVPDYAEPHINLGNLYKDRGDLDAAIAAYRRAIELRPDLSMLHSNLLLTLHYHAAVSPVELADEHRRWAERHVKPLVAERRAHANRPDPDRAIRIGYVSPDFREHAIARFVIPLFAKHNRERFEVVAYADNTEADETTNRIRGLCDGWREITAHDDAQLAARVRDDRIDILVDLAAHSGRNRLLTFARKPAPVQVTYLAYCSTTGVDAIDYRLTDRWLDPPGTDLSLYSEQSVYLPDCYWCYSPPARAVASPPSTSRAPGPPTFACLNNFAKVTDVTLELWMRLLARAPDSRLLLYARGDSHQERVKRFVRAAGLAESRIDFVGRQPLLDYLETYRTIDVALDPYPFNGGTTTCDALWMGVPVVSLAGSTAVSRAGSSLLSNAGLEHLAARTADEYIELAARLIEDQGALATMRRELRARLEASPIMDAPRFVQGLERSFRQMWHDWCATHT